MREGGVTALPLACIASRGTDMNDSRGPVRGNSSRGDDGGRFAEFDSWERKVLVATDKICTLMSFVLQVVAMLFLFGSWSAQPGSRLNADASFVLANALKTATLAAHVWVMRARRGWYAVHREAVVVAVRLLTFTFIMAGYVHSGAWEVSKSWFVIARLFWGLWGTVGWQVSTLLSLVFQLALFTLLRLGLALKEFVLDTKEEWRCAPMAICWPSSKLSAMRRAELELEQDFSFTKRGFILDFSFVVVMPALILLVKKRHSRLMFAIENQRARRTSRGRLPPQEVGQRSSMNVRSNGMRRTSDIDEAFRLGSQITDVFKKFWKGSTVWAPLMEFRDPVMEARFEYWHRSQMFTVDLLKCGVSLVTSSLYYIRVRPASPSTQFTSSFYFLVNLLQTYIMLTQKQTYVQYRTQFIIGLRLVLVANSVTNFLSLLNSPVVGEGGFNLSMMEISLLLAAIQAIGMHLLMRSFIMTFAAMNVISFVVTKRMAVEGFFSRIEGVKSSVLLEKIGFSFGWFENKTQTEMMLLPLLAYTLVSLLTTFVVENRHRTVFLRMQVHSDTHDDGRQSEVIRQAHFSHNTASEEGGAEPDVDDSTRRTRSVRRRTSARA